MRKIGLEKKVRQWQKEGTVRKKELKKGRTVRIGGK